MVRSHYVQDARLKNFAVQNEDKFKITMIDLNNKKVGIRNTSSAFWQRDLYPEEMELDLLHKVETPGMKVFDKVYNSKNKKVVLTREEQGAMQKYLLIQAYRNPTNIATYSPGSPDDPLHFSKVFKNEEESRNFVYKMMHIIIDTPWDELYKSEEDEIRVNVYKTMKKATMFVRSDQEFVINDLGIVGEYAHYTPSKEEWQNRKDFLLEMSKRSNDSATESEIDNYLNKQQFIENFAFIPISSHFGIITIEENFTQLLKNGHSYEYIRANYHRNSPFLHDNFSSKKDFCNVRYMRDDLIRREKNFDEAVFKYGTPHDRFTYTIKDITDEETYYLNSLTINEARDYIGFKTPENVIPSIKYYNYLRIDKICEIGASLGISPLLDEKTLLDICPYHHDLKWVQKNLDWKNDLP